jgi:hypothetical protein
MEAKYFWYGFMGFYAAETLKALFRLWKTFQAPKQCPHHTIIRCELGRWCTVCEKDMPLTTSNEGDK